LEACVSGARTTSYSYPPSLCAAASNGQRATCVCESTSTFLQPSFALPVCGVPPTPAPDVGCRHKELICPTDSKPAGCVNLPAQKPCDKVGDKQLCVRTSGGKELTCTCNGKPYAAPLCAPTPPPPASGGGNGTSTPTVCKNASPHSPVVKDSGPPVKYFSCEYMTLMGGCSNNMIKSACEKSCGACQTVDPSQPTPTPVPTTAAPPAPPPNRCASCDTWTGLCDTTDAVECASGQQCLTFERVTTSTLLGRTTVHTRSGCDVASWCGKYKVTSNTCKGFRRKDRGSMVETNYFCSDETPAQGLIPAGTLCGTHQSGAPAPPTPTPTPTVVLPPALPKPTAGEIKILLNGKKTTFWREILNRPTASNHGYFPIGSLSRDAFLSDVTLEPFTSPDWLTLELLKTPGAAPQLYAQYHLPQAAAVGKYKAVVELKYVMVDYTGRSLPPRTQKVKLVLKVLTDPEVHLANLLQKFNVTVGTDGRNKISFKSVRGQPVGPMELQGNDTLKTDGCSEDNPCEFGDLDISPGAELEVAAGSLLKISGALSCRGSLKIKPGSSVEVAPSTDESEFSGLTDIAVGAVLKIVQGAKVKFSASVGGGGTLDIAQGGTVEFDSPEPSFLGTPGKTMHNNGTLQITRGEIQFRGPLLSKGPFNVSEEAIVRFGSSDASEIGSAGNPLEVEGTVQFEGSGEVLLGGALHSKGFLNLTAGSKVRFDSAETSTVGGQGFVNSGHTTVGAGILKVEGSFSSTGTISLRSNRRTGTGGGKIEFGKAEGSTGSTTHRLGGTVDLAEGTLAVGSGSAVQVSGAFTQGSAARIEVDGGSGQDLAFLNSLDFTGDAAGSTPTQYDLAGSIDIKSGKVTFSDRAKASITGTVSLENPQGVQGDFTPTLRLNGRSDSTVQNLVVGDSTSAEFVDSDVFGTGTEKYMWSKANNYGSGAGSTLAAIGSMVMKAGGIVKATGGALQVTQGTIATGARVELESIQNFDGTSREASLISIGSLKVGGTLTGGTTELPVGCHAGDGSQISCEGCTIEPGSVRSSRRTVVVTPGTMVFDTLTMDNSSVLTLNVVSPTSYDRVVVSGALQLAGRLNVAVDNSTSMDLNGNWQLLSGNPVSGNFNTMVGVNAISYTNGAVTATELVAGAVPVAAPTSLPTSSPTPTSAPTSVPTPTTSTPTPSTSTPAPAQSTNGMSDDVLLLVCIVMGSVTLLLFIIAITFWCSKRKGTATAKSFKKFDDQQLEEGEVNIDMSKK